MADRQHQRSGRDGADPTPAAGADSWLPVPAIDDVDLPTVLHALADPVRLEIVRMLADRGESTCTALGLTQSPATLSHHMRVLRDSGVVATRLEGASRPSRLRRDDLERRFPGLLGAILGPKS